MSSVSNSRLMITGEKGLANPLGHNNCFLNSILQVLYHLSDFREELIEAAEDAEVPLFKDESSDELPEEDLPKDTNEESILRNIVHLFKKYDRAHECLLDPSEVRRGIASILPSFKSGTLQDAHECLDVLLSFLDTALVNRHSLSAGAREKPKPHEVPTSIPQKFFGIHTEVSPSCGCGDKSGRVVYTDSFYFTIWAPVLIQIAFDKGEEHGFQRMLVGVDQPITCDSCNQKVSLDKKLRAHPNGQLSNPRIMPVNVSWAKESASRTELRKFVSSVPVRFRLQETIACRKPVTPILCVLTGVVFYYGLHYVSAMYNQEYNVWVVFDDNNVRAVAKTLPGLWRYAVNGRLMPFMLFYRVGMQDTPAVAALLKCFEVVAEGEPNLLSVDRRLDLYGWLEKNTRSDFSATAVPAPAAIDVDSSTPKTPPQRQDGGAGIASPSENTMVKELTQLLPSATGPGSPVRAAKPPETQQSGRKRDMGPMPTDDSPLKKVRRKRKLQDSPAFLQQGTLWPSLHRPRDEFASTDAQSHFKKGNTFGTGRPNRDRSVQSKIVRSGVSDSPDAKAFEAKSTEELINFLYMSTSERPYAGSLDNKELDQLIKEQAIMHNKLVPK
eukprot:TRINITY_DN1701_c1_g1_i1.p1 TRINITY_DN1701_c1_g1~~TRINITY_DN1701_c1_g1_i1.p1  ORF type:complete len:611 (+),score=143.75 TRINITY_DN1701_c1_g1_i1:150-1982(+)